MIYYLSHSHYGCVYIYTWVTQFCTCIHLWWSNVVLLYIYSNFSRTGIVDFHFGGFVSMLLNFPVISVVECFGMILTIVGYLEMVKVVYIIVILSNTYILPLRYLYGNFTHILWPCLTSSPRVAYGTYFSYLASLDQRHAVVSLDLYFHGI